jgi:hypothetical protein
MLNVTLDNFLGIFEVAHLVPHSFGVDHNAGPKLAGVQAACDVSPNLLVQTQPSDFFFEEFPEGLRTFFTTAASGVPFWSSIGADKEMILVGRHSQMSNLTDSTPG